MSSSNRTRRPFKLRTGSRGARGALTRIVDGRTMTGTGELKGVIDGRTMTGTGELKGVIALFFRSLAQSRALSLEAIVLQILHTRHSLHVLQLEDMLKSESDRVGAYLVLL